MKKLYLTAVAMACGISFSCNRTWAQATYKSIDKPSKHELVNQKTTPKLFDSNNNWVPLKEESYSFEPEAKVWNLSSVAAKKYNHWNKVSKEKVSVFDSEGDVMFAFDNSYSYNDRGNLIEKVSLSSIDGTTWVNDIRNVLEYDVVRQDNIILDEIYFWDASKDCWSLDIEDESNIFIEVKRDDNNRVERTTIWDNRDMNEKKAKLEFLYNMSGKPNIIIWYGQNENGEFKAKFVYEDIKWQTTDNQFVDISPSVYYPFIDDNNNVLKSYTLFTSRPDGSRADLVAFYTAEFDTKERLKKETISFADQVSTYETEFFYDLDANGSYELKEKACIDENGDGKIDDLEVDNYRFVTTINEYGEIVLEEGFATNPNTGEEEQEEGFRYDMTYDERGLLTQMIFSFYSQYVEENNGYDFLSKTVYSDYVDNATSISASSQQNASVTYYNDALHFNNAYGEHYRVCNLKGQTIMYGRVTEEQVSLAELPEGIYIVRMNGKSSNRSLKLIKK